MTDAQLLESTSSATFNDIVTQATTAYNGQTDPATQKVLQEGVVQICQDIQRLATLDVREYQH